MGDIVPREQVPAAVMANGMSFNLMRSIGPALGGVIVVALGAAAAFALNAASYGSEQPRVRRLLERETVPKQADPHIKGYEEHHH